MVNNGEIVDMLSHRSICQSFDCQLSNFIYLSKVKKISKKLGRIVYARILFPRLFGRIGFALMFFLSILLCETDSVQ